MRSFRFLAIVTLLLPTVAQAQFYYSPYAPAPTTGVSRASFVEMVMARAGSLQGGTNCFTDVKTQSFAPAVCAAKAMGIVTGDANGKFRPNDAISFVEATAVAVRATGAAVPYDNPWYKGYLTLLADWNAFPHSVTNILYPINSVQAQDLITSVFSADHSANSGNNSSNNTGSGSDGDNNDDVHLTVTSSRSSADVGDIVTYTIKVRNEENHDLNNLDVRAYIDKDFDYVSSSDSGDYDNDRVEWEIDVDEDETETVTLKLRVSGGADDGDKLSFRVKADDSEVRKILTVDDDNDDDDDDDNDDLRISITDSPSSAEAGDTVTYTIRVENRDDDDIRVDVRALLDDEMDFVSASNGGDEDDDEVEWDNLFIDENDEEVLTLKVRLSNDVDEGDTVRLEVRAEGEKDTETTEIDDDGNSGDDDINISVSDSPDPADRGEVVTYTIRLENNSGDDDEFDIVAELDDDMLFLSASDSGDLEGHRIEWNNFDIDEDDTETISFRVQIRSDADRGETLRVRVRVNGDEEEVELTTVED